MTIPPPSHEIGARKPSILPAFSVVHHTTTFCVPSHSYILWSITLPHSVFHSITLPHSVVLSITLPHYVVHHTTTFCVPFHHTTTLCFPSNYIFIQYLNMLSVLYFLTFDLSIPVTFQYLYPSVVHLSIHLMSVHTVCVYPPVVHPWIICGGLSLNPYVVH